jgi:hypothetical protein
MLVLPSVLETDIDGYRRLAHNLIGNGVLGIGNVPSAYRPPLYPLVLAPFALLAPTPERIGIAALHLLLGIATVALTMHVGQALGLARGALVAGLLVAVDPLLLYWGTQLMTETLHAFLLAVVLAVLIKYWKCGVRAAECGVDPTAGPLFARWRSRLGLAVLGGTIAGLAALCRPETWSFVVLVFTVLVAGAVMSRGRLGNRPSRWEVVAAPCVFLLTTWLICLPWTIRNRRVLGVPVVTTTHGGYTLLLANNPVFYREVAGAVWEKPSSDDWHDALEQRLRGLGEIERDRACYREAFSFIRAQPLDFLHAIPVRIVRLWRPVPHDIAWGVPRADLARCAMGVFYGAELILMLAATGAGITWRRPRLLLIALVVSTTLVHAVYWSDMRMRAGVIPAVALLAASALSRGGCVHKLIIYKKL